MKRTFIGCITPYNDTTIRAFWKLTPVKKEKLFLKFYDWLFDQYEINNIRVKLITIVKGQIKGSTSISSLNRLSTAARVTERTILFDQIIFLNIMWPIVLIPGLSV